MILLKLFLLKCENLSLSYNSGKCFKKQTNKQTNKLGLCRNKVDETPVSHISRLPSISLFISAWSKALEIIWYL
jgi:hypothetical protein